MNPTLVRWLKGLAAAAIGGGANAISLGIVDPEAFSFKDNGAKLFTFVGVNALIAVAMYLKASPLPEDAPNA